MKKRILKWCSGVCGDVSRAADGFRCRHCDATIQEADLSEDLMVDGETYGCVKNYCYLGDTLYGEGGHLAATARITFANRKDTLHTSFVNTAIDNMKDNRVLNNRPPPINDEETLLSR